MSTRAGLNSRLLLLIFLAADVWLFSAGGSLHLPLSGAPWTHCLLYPGLLSHGFNKHHTLTNATFRVRKYTQGCGNKAQLTPKMWRKGATYLDAEWCAAFEKLLYVVQTLAVVFRFLVNLQKRLTPVKGSTSSSRRGFPAAPAVVFRS